jgi:hypothetical protein
MKVAVLVLYVVAFGVAGHCGPFLDAAHCPTEAAQLG